MLADVSGSMYRFNGLDGRLERSMEAVCMVMEALESYEHKFKVSRGVWDPRGGGRGYRPRWPSADSFQLGFVYLWWETE